MGGKGRDRKGEGGVGKREGKVIKVRGEKGREMKEGRGGREGDCLMSSVVALTDHA